MVPALVGAERALEQSSAASERLASTDIVCADASGAGSSLSQSIHEHRFLGDDFEAALKLTRITGDKQLAYMASNAIVDYMCAVTGRTEEERRSDDMRGLEIMFLDSFQRAHRARTRNAVASGHAQLAQLTRRGGISEGFARLVDQALGPKKSLKLVRALLAERHDDLALGQRTVEENTVKHVVPVSGFLDFVRETRRKAPRE
jgi:hypothetical protein